MPNTDNIRELNPSSHDERGEKLIAMEKDLTKQANDLDVRITELNKREKALDNRVGVLESAEVFTRVQELINEAYTIASAHGLDPPGVFEAIKLMWDARNKFSPPTPKP